MTTKRRLTFKILLFLIATDILETFAQFYFKKSVSSQSFTEINNLFQAAVFIKVVFCSPFLWLALLFVFIIFVTWTTILSKIDLSVAVPVASFSYILVPLASSLFLHEKISELRWFGIIFIIIGVIFVSLSTGHKGEAV